MTKQKRMKMTRAQTRQAMAEIKRCEQVRREAIRFTLLEIAEMLKSLADDWK